MLCYICKQNEATVHLAQITEGKMQKLDLCEACAKEKGVSDAGNVSLASLLLGLGASEEVRAEGGGLRCSTCGMTQADFKKTGRLGCNDCWEQFAAALAPLLKAMHKGERHVGKVPSRAVQTIALTDRIRELTETLEKAVRAERYEEAAQLRDQVRELEGQLRTAGREAL